MKRWILMIFCIVFLCGCSRDAAAPAATEQAEQSLQQETADTVPLPVTQPPEEQLPAPPVSIVLRPEPSGTARISCEDAVIDYSHAEDGYVMVCYTGQTESRLKVQTTDSKTTYTYNLIPEQWAVLPLSEGDGIYRVSIYRNVGGTRYATVLSGEISVELRDEFAPFLRPNQYVNYLEAPAAVEKGALLCAGLEDTLKKVEAVYDFVVGTLRYDYDKASSVKSGYLPVLDEILAAEKGICFDYAALMTAMLRSQQIPCKLVVGYAGSTYHAWISVWTEENGWVDGAIFFDGQAWRRMDPTFASTQPQNQEIQEFIENGNYKEKYLY